MCTPITRKESSQAVDLLFKVLRDLGDATRPLSDPEKVHALVHIGHLCVKVINAVPLSRIPKESVRL